jgi:hypothetical protein
MLALQRRFRLNDAEVTAQVLDGEAIIINLSTGVYYSMDKVGGFLWEMIVEGYSSQEIAAAIVARYHASPEQVQADVEQVVEELIQENLIVSAGTISPPQTPEEKLPQQKDPYESPKLNIYRDMSDLLALDPPMPMPTLTEIPWKAQTDGPPS